MKFVRRDLGEAAEASSGGGGRGMVKEALVLVAAALGLVTALYFTVGFLVNLMLPLISFEREQRWFGSVHLSAHDSPEHLESDDRLHRANLILDLANEFETLTGDRAQEMLKESLKIEGDRTKLKNKYIKKFNKVLPPKTVVRFLQIENKLDAVINYELAAAIPLVRPDVAAPQE